VIEEELAGGNKGPVHRRGDTVLRTAGEWTPAVHRLLRHCRDAGFTGAPEPLGLTDDGREVLSFLEGDVPAYPLPLWAWSEDTLTSSAELLRDFHAVSASADHAGPWRSLAREPEEVLCHNDFAPYNLVYREGQAVGVIDFDFASPGSRLWDLAYLVYRLAPLTTDRADGFRDAERLARLDRIVGAYGGNYSRAEVLAAVVARLEHLAAFSDEKAVELDNPELRDHADLYRADIALVEALRDAATPGASRR
jgi:hypothetical protein